MQSVPPWYFYRIRCLYQQEKASSTCKVYAEKGLKMRKETLTTVDAAPPGQQPSKIKPTERDGESPKVLLITIAKVGIIVYCATHPNRI